MTIRRITWPLMDDNTITFPLSIPKNNYYRGYDIHILRNGQSTGDLRSNIYAFLENAGTWSAPPLNDPSIPNNTKIEFIPNLLGGDSHNTSHFNDVNYVWYNINGVSIHTYTGEIKAAPLLPNDPDYLKNFNFVLKIRINGNENIITKVRVHIHDSLVSAWVTPTTFTVREGESNRRFSVFAEFSDGVIGDITNTLE